MCNFDASNIHTMEESKRQKQVAKLIQEEMTLIFQKEGLNMVQGGMVSLSKVMVTPDLLEARIHLSFFKIADPKAIMAIVKEKMGELRGALGNKLRHQLRRIPELQFFEDDTLDHVSKIEDLLNKIRNEQ
jgi:ribosome-binding factor A